MPPSPFRRSTFRPITTQGQILRRGNGRKVSTVRPSPASSKFQPSRDGFAPVVERQSFAGPRYRRAARNLDARRAAYRFLIDLDARRRGSPASAPPPTPDASGCGWRALRGRAQPRKHRDGKHRRRGPLTGGGRLDPFGGPPRSALDAARPRRLAQLAERIAPGGRRRPLPRAAGAFAGASGRYPRSAGRRAVPGWMFRRRGRHGSKSRLTDCRIGAALLLKPTPRTRLACQLGLARIAAADQGNGARRAWGEGHRPADEDEGADAACRRPRRVRNDDATLAFDRAAPPGCRSTADATPSSSCWDCAGDLARRIPLDASMRASKFRRRGSFGSVFPARSPAGNQRPCCERRRAFFRRVASPSGVVSALPRLSLVLGPAHLPRLARHGQIRFAPSLFDPPRASSTGDQRGRVDLGIATAGDAQADIAFSPAASTRKHPKITHRRASLAGDVAHASARPRRRAGQHPRD